MERIRTNKKMYGEKRRVKKARLYLVIADNMIAFFPFFCSSMDFYVLIFQTLEQGMGQYVLATTSLVINDVDYSRCFITSEIKLISI